MFALILTVVAVLLLRQIRHVLVDRPDSRPGMVLSLLIVLSVHVFLGHLLRPRQAAGRVHRSAHPRRRPVLHRRHPGDRRVRRHHPAGSVGADHHRPADRLQLRVPDPPRRADPADARHGGPSHGPGSGPGRVTGRTARRPAGGPLVTGRAGALPSSRLVNGKSGAMPVRPRHCESGSPAPALAGSHWIACDPGRRSTGGGTRKPGDRPRRVVHPRGAGEGLPSHAHSRGFLPPAHAIAWGAASAPFVVHGVRSLTVRSGSTRRARCSSALRGLHVRPVGPETAVRHRQLLASHRHRSGRDPLPAAGHGGAGHHHPALPGAVARPRRTDHARANVFSMAVVGPWAGYGAYRLLRRYDVPLMVTVFCGAFVADLSTYCVTSVQLALAFPDPGSGFLGARQVRIGLRRHPDPARGERGPAHGDRDAAAGAVQQGRTDPAGRAAAKSGTTGTKEQAVAR